jgi:phenylpropionate dioxygenase-like ring-hydroxylating dioxygenase large terminal subunit
VVTETLGINYHELIGADRVHGSLYYDPEIFHEEIEKIWHREWIWVGHSSEVQTPGDYCAKLIGLQPVIMVRDEDGEVRLFMNRCPHRGNLICHTERGNTHAFRCNYHGWTFSNKGNCLGVPYAGAYGSDFSKSEYSLAAVPRVGFYRGFVFGSLSAEGPTLEEHLGPARRLIDMFVDLSPTGEIETRAGKHKLLIRANWKLWVENGTDNYHAQFVHQSGLQMLGKELRERAIAVSGEESAAVSRDLGRGHAQLDFFPQQRKTGRIYSGRAGSLPDGPQGQYLHAMEARHGKERARQIVDDGPPHVVIFPNLYLIQNDIRTIQPVSSTVSYMYHYPVLLKGAPPEINSQRLRLHESAYGPAGSFGPDDVETFERIQLALQARVNDWVVLRRGLQREHLDEEGMLISHITDEISQRAIWRNYLELMSRR